MDEQKLGILEIRALFARHGLAEAFEEQSPLLLWAQVAGERLGRLAQPVKVKDGVLHLVTSNPVVAQELSAMKEAYLSRLNELTGEVRLRDLRFHVGGSPELGLPQDPARRRSEQLSLLNQEELSRLLDQVEDPGLRGTFERLIGAIVRRRRRRCAVCGALRDPGRDGICEACRRRGGRA